MDFCAVAIALGAVLGIVFEPVFVFLNKLLEFSGFFQRFPLLLESDLEIFPFGFQYLGIVDGFFFVEDCPHPLERFFPHVIPSGIYGGKSVLIQLFNVQINRIQCKSRNGIIRIGIAPVIMRCRVVDG